MSSGIWVHLLVMLTGGEVGGCLPEFAYYPAGICKWTDEISSEVCTLETTSFSSCDTKSILKFSVQDIK